MVNVQFVILSYSYHKTVLWKTPLDIEWCLEKRNHSQMAITTNFMHIIMFHSSNFIKSSVTNLSVDLITKNDSLCLRK